MNHQDCHRRHRGSDRLRVSGEFRREQLEHYLHRVLPVRKSRKQGQDHWPPRTPRDLPKQLYVVRVQRAGRSRPCRPERAFRSDWRHRTIGCDRPHRYERRAGPSRRPGVQRRQGRRGRSRARYEPAALAFPNYTLESTDRAPNGCALARPAGTDPFVVTYVATQSSMGLYLGPICEGSAVVPSLSRYGGGNAPLSEAFSPGFVVPAGSALSIRSSGGQSWINGYIAPSN